MAAKVKGIPDTSSVVIPRLVCRDPASAIDFCASTSDAVDRTVERAVARGARILVPAEDQFWGDRIAWIMDPSGHVWTIATRIEETSEQQRRDRWSSVLEGQGRT